MVGDADPAMMEELIRARFGGWRAEGPAPAEPDYGRIAEVPQPVANLAYPGSPTAVNLIWLRPLGGDAAHPGPRAIVPRGGAGASRSSTAGSRRMRAANPPSSAAPSTRRARATSPTPPRCRSSPATATGATRWPRPMRSSATRCAHRRAGAEIERELSNIRTAADGAVQAEPTVQSQVRAEQMVNAVDNGSVVATAQTVLDNFEANARLMTPERIGQAMQAMFTGSGPRMLIVSPTPVAGGDDRARRGPGRRARHGAGAARRRAPRSASTICRALGTPGRVVSRQRIEDMDVTIVRFANGSTLTFKRTEFERGSVSVQLRFGGGVSAMSPTGPSLGWLAGLVAPSGLAGLDLNGMERLLTGRRIGLSFGIDEDAFVLGGRPTPPICTTSSACSPPSSSIRAGTRPCCSASGPPRWRASTCNVSSASARAGARAGRRDPPQRPALAADREDRDAGGDGRAVPRLLRPLSRRRARSTRSSSATSAWRPRSRRCGGRSAPCRGGRCRRRRRAPARSARPRPTRSRAASPIRAIPTRPMR